MTMHQNVVIRMCIEEVSGVFLVANAVVKLIALPTSHREIQTERMGCYRGWNCCALIPPSTLAGIYR
jgi:hypothetical protein